MIVMPLTSNVSRVYPGETIVVVKGQRSKVMADQIMTADKARLKSQIATLSKAEIVAVDDVIRVQLALPK